MRAAVRRAVRWGASLLAAGCAALWWVAVWRLALRPEEAGVLEAAVAGGGWSLGLLPVHAAPRSRGTTWSDLAGAVRRYRSEPRVSRRPEAEAPSGSPGTKT